MRIAWDELYRTRRLRPYSGRLLIYRKPRHLATILLRELHDVMHGLRIATDAVLKEGCLIEGAYLSGQEGELVDAALVVSCPRGQEESLAEKIRDMGLCKEVLIIETPDPSIGGNPFFPIKVAGTRAVVFRETVYGGIFKGARVRFGEEAAKAFLYHVGLEVGREACEALRPFMEGKDLAHSLKVLFFIGTVLGYSKLESMEVSSDKVTLSLLENFEAVSLSRQYKTPQCSFTRAILEAFIGRLSGANWSSEEDECLASGGERCRFIFSRIH